MNGLFAGTFGSILEQDSKRLSRMKQVLALKKMAQQVVFKWFQGIPLWKFENSSQGENRQTDVLRQQSN